MIRQSLREKPIFLNLVQNYTEDSRYEHITVFIMNLNIYYSHLSIFHGKML